MKTLKELFKDYDKNNKKTVRETFSEMDRKDIEIIEKFSRTWRM